MGLMDRGGNYADLSSELKLRHVGTVVSVDEVDAMYEGKPKLTAAGRQVRGYEILIRKDDGDTVMIDFSAWRAVKAIQEAVIAAGMTDLLPGSRLDFGCTGTEPGKGAAPAKTWSAVVTPRTSGLAPVTEATTASTPPAAAETGARPAHISAELWALLSPDQQRAVAPAAPF